eukprot:14717125-Ditylum_brightwellii.AAC.1
MDSILCAINKEFSLPANYPKGHSDEFKTWLLKHHPSALLVPVTHATGSRQDLAVEGAESVYWNRKYYVQFLHRFLHALDDSKKSTLKENLFIVLTSIEMIALCCVMAILHFSICVPMRWIAGNTYHIGNLGNDWSVRSMGKAINALYDSMAQIKADGS